MSYILENPDEATRLEEQSQLIGYSLQSELKGVRLTPGSRVLDAGCGTGLGIRYLTDEFPGITPEACDFSDLRIQQAKKLHRNEAHSSIRYFQTDLENIQSEDNGYDFVLCRYVFEHLANPEIVAGELARILRPGGVVHVINFDGILQNLSHTSDELTRMLQRLQEQLYNDVYIGRKIPQLLTAAGLEVSWNAETISFQGKSLEDELEQTRQRFSFATSAFKEILGPDTERFKNLYCEELMKPGNCLFYTKFIVQGRKPLGLRSVT